MILFMLAMTLLLLLLLPYLDGLALHMQVDVLFALVALMAVLLHFLPIIEILIHLFLQIVQSLRLEL